MKRVMNKYWAEINVFFVSNKYQSLCNKFDFSKTVKVNAYFGKQWVKWVGGTHAVFLFNLATVQGLEIPYNDN